MHPVLDRGVETPQSKTGSNGIRRHQDNKSRLDFPRVFDYPPILAHFQGIQSRGPTHASEPSLSAAGATHSRLLANGNADGGVSCAARLGCPGIRSCSPASGVPADQPAPEKVIVSDVIISGSQLAPIEEIKNQLKTRVGKEYISETLQEDVRTLYVTKQFGNVWASTQEDGPQPRQSLHLHPRSPSHRPEGDLQGQHQLQQRRTGDDDREHPQGQSPQPAGEQGRVQRDRPANTTRKAGPSRRAICSRGARWATPR